VLYKAAALLEVRRVWMFTGLCRLAEGEEGAGLCGTAPHYRR
jgi:hypothetical protein